MDLESQLRRLIAKEAIREAITAYSRGIDRHDDAIMASAYHPDAIDDHGAYIGGPAGLIDRAGRNHDLKWRAHQHFLANQTIELDGDTAHAETYFLATLARHEGGVVDLVGGRYVDRLECRDGRWAIADRVCVIEWHAEAPESERRDLLDPDLFQRGAHDPSDVSYLRPLRQTRDPRNFAP